MTDNLSPEASKVLGFGTKAGLFDCDAMIIGLSGGPDSVMLGEVLCEIRSVTEGFPKLFAVHINHNIREEAGNDEAFAADWAKAHGVEFRSYSFDIPKLSKEMGRSEEETGRILRYKAFREFADGIGEKRTFIAVAHHKDDIAETMMLNLFRGSGLDGLVSPVAKNGQIVRPLLCLTKAEILRYLTDRGISYCTDKTNDSTDYSRNAWRNEIFPMISKYSVKSPTDALSDTYELLKADLELIDKLTDKAYEEAVIREVGHPFIRTDFLKGSEEAIAGRLIRRLWGEIFGNLTDLSSTNVREAKEVMTSDGHAARQIDMPFGRICIRAGGFATFCENGDETRVMRLLSTTMGYVVVPSRVSVPIECGKTTILPNSDIQITCEIIENSDELAYNNKSWFYPIFDDRIPEGFKAGSGDLSLKFRNAGSDSSKPLSRLFADRHIPRQARDGILYLELEGEIMWIPGIGATCGAVSSRAYDALVKAAGGAVPRRFLRFCIA